MRDQISQLIETGEHPALSLLLDGADMSTLRFAAKQFVSALQENNDDLLQSIPKLMNESSTGAHHLACQLIPYAYEIKRRQAVGFLPRLIESTDWTVRDAACEVTGRLLRDDFSRMLPVLEAWRSRQSSNMSRALAIATIRAADPMHLERADPLLRLLEPLLSERDPIVRRNLGPSAIGTTLLAHYPSQTFEYLAKWSTSYDAQTLWNVAMAFTSPAAVPITKKALIVLRKLSLDERRLVWRAVASAMWKLGRKRPDLIRPELARWLEDERRVNVAREAIKHL
ncbi:DNA alkylation repair protein [Candidatus Bipolaricaulota bacterium]|nr:DNA alkylation repair protein [Candidatus Bipolaricaulota bacterium]